MEAEKLTTTQVRRPLSENIQEMIMGFRKSTNELSKRDALLALVISILALTAYVRTLAPDVLYGDSAEFQCLAYTFGITHSTGYPIYLLLSRLVGYLPISNPAWRISLFSAISAAITVGGVYLVGRYFTSSKIGASLGSLALGVSYTFWSQAVIAEVYTPGMAFLVMIVILLFRWEVDPKKRTCSLMAAALLAGIGFGVHASVWLIGPPAVVFVVWVLRSQHTSRTTWFRSITAGFTGAVVGLLIFISAFLISDQLNSPTSFIRTTLEPSRVFWNLKPEDFNSPLNRLKMIVISEQWGNALFPGGEFSFTRELGIFFNRFKGLEFTTPVLIMGLIGLVFMLLNRPVNGVFILLWFLFSLFFIINYRVGDKYVFYLSLYIPLVIAVATGMGSALAWVDRQSESRQGRGKQLVFLLPVLFFVTMVIQPFASTRWDALRSGVANFVIEDYVFPAYNLSEPRLVAQITLAGAAHNAVFVMDWRALYTTAYLAHVENGMTNTLFFEAMPYGNNGKVAPTLITVLEDCLEEGRPVFVEKKYPDLEDHFRLLPTGGNLYTLSQKK